MDSEKLRLLERYIKERIRAGAGGMESMTDVIFLVLVRATRGFTRPVQMTLPNGLNWRLAAYDLAVSRHHAMLLRLIGCPYWISGHEGGYERSRFNSTLSEFTVWLSPKKHGFDYSAFRIGFNAEKFRRAHEGMLRARL